MTATKNWICQCGKNISPGEYFEILDGEFICEHCLDILTEG